MMRGILAAAMSCLVAFAVTGTTEKAPQEEGLKWDNSVQLVSEVSPESNAPDRLDELAKQIAESTAEVRRLSEEMKKDIGLKGPGFAPPLQAPTCDCKCPTIEQIRDVVRSELQRCNLTIKGADGVSKTTAVDVPTDGTPKALELQPGEVVTAINGQPVSPFTYQGETSNKTITRFSTPAYDMRAYDSQGGFSGAIRYSGGGGCANGSCSVPQSRGGLFRR